MGAHSHNHHHPLPGYAVALLHKTCGLSYVAGAPRYKHRGAVFELQKEGRETNFVPVLEGEQVPAGEGHPHYYRWRESGGPGGDGTGSKAHCVISSA